MAELETVNQENGTGTENQEKTFTQAEVNKMVVDRVAREKAKYADYDQMKEKAGKYDEITESGKSETQKAIERAEKAEKELADLRKINTTRDVREKVSKETGIPANLLTGEDEDTCNAQAKAMLEYFKPDSYPSVKDAGENHRNGKKTAAEEFAEWFNQTIN